MYPYTFRRRFDCGASLVIPGEFLMNYMSLLSSVLLACLIAPACAQESAPAADAAKKSPEAILTKESPEKVNADLVAARAATKDKRFADSEALMKPITESQPDLVLPWIELGQAQIALKKYTEAEYSFKKALGIAPVTKNAAGGGFYQPASGPGAVAPDATRGSRNTLNGGTVTNGEDRSPEIQGVAWSSLGQIYALTNRPADAQAAFDNAVKIYPREAALYRGNETIFFFQAGNSAAQFDAAQKAIALDPSRAILYYFKGQAMVSNATVDPRTQKTVLPPGCAEAYEKYLQLDPKGQFANDARGILTAAGIAAGGSPAQGRK